MIKWDSNVLAMVEKGVNGISWEAQKKRLNPDGNWTLVHGDCWPGNFMWMVGEKFSDPTIKLLDWEMVGIGSGPQDLGQYVISNMEPALRAECEYELVQAYYQELLENNVDVDWEYVRTEYKIGGVERWLWFLVYFVGMEMGDWAQFFHDQIMEFCRHHKLSPDSITQPRP